MSNWMNDWIWGLYMAPDGTKMITYHLRTDQGYEREERKSVSNLTGSWEPIEPGSPNWPFMAILSRPQVVKLIEDKLTCWLENPK